MKSRFFIIVKSIFTIILMLFIIITPGCGKSDREKAYEDPWDVRPGKIVPLTIAIPTSISDKYDIEDPLYASRLRKVAGELEKRSKKFYVNFIHAVNPASKFYFSNLKVDAAFINTHQLYSSPYPFRDLESMNSSNIKDITNEFMEYAPEYFAKFTPGDLIPVTVSKRIFAIPSHHFPGTRRVCAFIREDLAEKYNVTGFRGWEDYEKFLSQIAKNEPNLNPVVIYASTCELFAEEMGYTIYQKNLVYKNDDKNRKLLSFYETPEYLKVLERLASWASKELVRLVKTPQLANPDTGNYSYYPFGMFSFEKPFMEKEITNGSIASFLAMSPFGDYLDDALARYGRIDLKYRQVEILPHVLTERIVDPGNIVVFNKYSPNVKHAISFINWLMTDAEAYRLMLYGIEGEDYKINDKGLPEPIAPESRTVQDAFYYWQTKWFLYDYDNDEYLSEDKKKEQLKLVNQKTEYKQHHGIIESLAMYHRNLSDSYLQRTDFLTHAERFLLAGMYSLREAIDRILEEREYSTKYSDSMSPEDIARIQKSELERQQRLKDWDWKKQSIDPDG